MSEFNSCKYYKILEALAKRPIDLTKDGVLSLQRIKDFQSKNGPFSLLYATQRVDQKVLDALFALAKERKTVDNMHLMQDGEVLNFISGIECENRSALHTAMRDFFDVPRKATVAKEATKLAYEELLKLKKFIKKTEDFTDIIHIGIGGSALGPKAIYTALEFLAKKKVYFVSNVDPDNIEYVLKKINLKKTLVISVSKSGTTPETLNNELLIRKAFERAKIDANRHVVAVTGKNSPMDNPKKYLESFYIWDYVGGRYSATSMVGAVSLCLSLGEDNFMQILKGAHEMDKIALEEGKNNLPLMAALLGIWNRNFLSLPTLAVVPYSQALNFLVEHLQQCDMESNGKMLEKTGKLVDFATGPIIFGGTGTDCQHSFFQYLHQGSQIVPVEFIGFTNSQYENSDKLSQQKLLSNLFAQACALALGKNDKNPNKMFFGNRPSSILLADRLTPFNMGALLAYFEHKVVFQGFLWDINSFDQEGVQLGKILADKFFSAFNGKNDFLLAEGFIKTLR